MSVLTQGTHLFFIDPEPTSELGQVVRVVCVTSHNPGGAPSSTIDDSCLDYPDQILRKGWRTPAAATIGINSDPKEPSHVRLFELYQSTKKDFEKIQWAVGWSDGDALPEVDSEGNWNFPTTRSFFSYEGYVSDFPFDFQQNAVVATSITVQRSGGAKWTRKQSS